MLHLHRKKFSATLVAVLIIVALIFVANPELRAFLLFTDSLGLDLLVLLLATQLRHFSYALLPASNAIVGVFCGLAFWIGSGAMRTYPKALGWWPFDELLCPALVSVTYGIRCGGT